MLESMSRGTKLYREKEIKRRGRKRKFVGYRMEVSYQDNENSSGGTGRDREFASFEEMRKFYDRVWSEDPELNDEWSIWRYSVASVFIYEYTTEGKVFEVGFHIAGTNYAKEESLAQTGFYHSKENQGRGW